MIESHKSGPGAAGEKICVVCLWFCAHGACTLMWCVVCMVLVH